ncbi:MAG: hypothetical protein Q9165_000666 [Trypethelium subeluteriae]
MSTGILSHTSKLGSRGRRAIDLVSPKPRYASLGLLFEITMDGTNDNSDHVPDTAEERHDFAEVPDGHMDNDCWYPDEHSFQNEESPSIFHAGQYHFNADVQANKEVEHFQRFSSSCRALRTSETALFSSNRKLLCAYCGMLMGWQDNLAWKAWKARSHLRTVHRVGECSQHKTYASKKDFYQHLEDFHAASVSGVWIIALDSACAFELPGSAETLFNTVAPLLNSTTAHLERLWDAFKPPSNQHLSSQTESAMVNYLLRGPYDDLSFTQLVSKMRLAALCKEEIHLLNLVLSNWPLEHEDTINNIAHSMLMQRRSDLKMIKTGILKTAAADSRFQPQSANPKEEDILREWEKRLGEDLLEESPESSADFAIQIQSYNDSLLSTWTGNRDRVNRWLLHTLGSSTEQANIHRSMMHDPNMSIQSWSRLVLKYWYLDEAALGIEFEPSHSAAAAHSLDASSLWSSMFESCKSHLTDAVVLQEGDEYDQMG